MHERAFVLMPLAEIAPGAKVPGRGAARELLAGVDTGSVERVGSMKAEL
jgi:2-amino-4-hydroxy-6-hydroxymethyldihydropteridine diphosphokinase